VYAGVAVACRVRVGLSLPDTVDVVEDVQPWLVRRHVQLDKGSDDGVRIHSPKTCSVLAPDLETIQGKQAVLLLIDDGEKMFTLRETIH
jgi:hypothetical protein